MGTSPDFFGASSDAYARGVTSLVHYWYHPDSYDRCLPAEVAPEVVEQDKRIRGKLYIST